MKRIGEYTISEIIFRNDRTEVIRAHSKDGDSVVIKKLNDDIPDRTAVARFEREYEVISSFNSDLIMKVHSFVFEGHVPCMIMEDFHGRSLKSYLEHGWSTSRDDLPDNLEIAIKLVRAIGEIHANQIIHKDIHPGNILYNRNTGQIRIIDFGIATDLKTEEPNPVFLADEIQGNPWYMSPEQTGRTSRILDYRSDYYSLGVVLYYIFTGELPFDAADHMELIHAHLARIPTPPHIVNSAVPEVLGNIILRLLEKIPDDRYLSSTGIIYDLKKILDSIRNEGRCAVFRTGEKDINEHFHFPQKLYGRMNEIEILLEAWQKVADGDTGVAMITGYSGSGKTSLIRELYRPLTEKRGFFVSGKFEQLQSGAPYGPILSAFRELLLRIQGMDIESQEQWKNKLQKALGSEKDLLYRGIPELMNFFTGASVPALSEEESGSSYRNVLARFIDVFSDRDHPLILFLDDLQWADLSSLELIGEIVSAKAIRHIYIIGAYRDNEIDINHPLNDLLETVRTHDTVYVEIHLEGLRKTDISSFLKDMFQAEDGNIGELANICYEKTRGNPFYMMRFLSVLHQNSLIFFDAGHGHWDWNIEKIRQWEVTENVIDLIVPELRRLPGATLSVLQSASCIGNRFDLFVLNQVLNLGMNELREAVLTAINENFIVPVDDAYDKLKSGIQVDETFFRFVHDRIRQASYETLHESEAILFHRKLGDVFLHRSDLRKEARDIFGIVGQLNRAQQLLGKSESVTLAVLNHDAARIAKGSGAYDAANNYIREALQLSAGLLNNKPDLSVAFNLEAAEISILNKQYDTTDHHVKFVLENTSDILSRARAYKTRINYLYATHQLVRAVDTALEAFENLGFAIPSNPGNTRVGFELLQAMTALRFRGIESLKSIPRIRDIRSRAVMMIASEILSVLFAISKNLFSIVIFRMFRMTLRDGVDVPTPFIFTAMGMFFAALGLIDKGYALSRVGLDLSRKIPDPVNESRMLVLFYATVSHWKDPIRDSLQGLGRAYQIARAAGNAEFSSTAIGTLIVYRYFSGVDLKKLHNYIESVLDEAGSAQRTALGHVAMLHAAIGNLITETESPLDLVGKYYNEHDELAEALQNKDNTFLASFYLQKMIVAYHFRRFDAGVKFSEECEKYIDGIIGLFHTVMFYYYRTLLLLEMRRIGKDTGIKVRLKIDSGVRKLSKWAKCSPDNHSHRLMTVQAVMSDLSNDTDRALALFESAIHQTRKGGFVNDETVIMRLLLSFYNSRNLSYAANFIENRIEKLCRRWGADACLISDGSSSLNASSGQVIPDDTRTSTGSITGLRVDIDSLMKASRAISGEVHTKNLIDRLLNIAVYNAGARVGCLFLERHGELRPVGYVGFDRSAIDPKNDTAKTFPGGLLSSLIIHAFKTGENLTYDDLREESPPMYAEMANSPSIAGAEDRGSLVAMPVSYKGKILGVFYLQNDLVTGVFTPERIQFLEMLISQTVISLENARIYEELEDRVNERTQELNRAFQDIQTAQEKLVRLEKEATERQMAGGFAHEMRNALSGGRILLDQLIGATTPAGGSKSTPYENKKMLLKLHDLLSSFLDETQLNEAMVIMKQLFDSEENMEELLHVLDRSMDRAMTITQQVLEFSRIGKEQAEREKVNVTELLKGLVREYSANDETGGVYIREDLQSGISIEGLESHFHSMFGNLLKNSINAIQESEEKSDPGVITLNLKTDGEGFVFHITDNGPGIPGEIQDKIFDTFYTTRSEAGTGLGLGIVKKLVNLYGGSIALESQPGKGSTFKIVIPFSNKKFMHKTI